MPLYDVFCEITGFGGRTNEVAAIIKEAPDTSREVRIEFVTTVNSYAQFEFAADADRQNLRGGDRWNQVIPKVLDSNEVDYVVVLQSQAMLERQNSRSYFHKEIKIGLEIGSEFGRGVRFVIPCFLEPCDLLPVFQEEKINSIELAGKEGITPLVNTIKEDWVKRSDRNRNQVSD